MLGYDFWQHACRQQSRVVPSARHGSASELIHNDDFLASNNVVHILELQLFCLQGMCQVACPLLSGVIQVWSLHSTGMGSGSNPTMTHA